jgi:hypothetical protein
MSDQQPAPSTDEPATTHLPTQLRRGTQYIVYDPDLLAGTAHTLTADGTTTHRDSGRHGLLIIGFVLACAVAAPLLLADDGRWFIVWAFLGGVAGFVLAAIVNGLRRKRRSRVQFAGEPAGGARVGERRPRPRGGQPARDPQVPGALPALGTGTGLTGSGTGLTGQALAGTDAHLAQSRALRDLL